MINTLQQSLKNWELMICYGDQHFHHQNFESAYYYYSKSIEIAESGLQTSTKNKEKYIRPFILSCHNTGFSLIRLNQKKEGEHYYRFAHYRLMSLYYQKETFHSLKQLILEELKSAIQQITFQFSNTPLFIHLQVIRSFEKDVYRAQLNDMTFQQWH